MCVCVPVNYQNKDLVFISTLMYCKLEIRIPPVLSRPHFAGIFFKSLRIRTGLLLPQQILIGTRLPSALLPRNSSKDFHMKLLSTSYVCTSFFSPKIKLTAASEKIHL